jgi:hypothetical protein
MVRAGDLSGTEDFPFRRTTYEQRGNAMNVGLTDPKACEATRELAENAIAVRKNAEVQGKPFVIQWRQDTKTPRWQGDSDAGCGCGLFD